MECLVEPSVVTPVTMEVDPINIGPSWMDPILIYLTTGNLPTEKNKAKRVRFQLARYHVINGVLYKRGYTRPYL